MKREIQNHVVHRADGTTEIHIRRKSTGERVVALIDTADFGRIKDRYRWWSVLGGRSNRRYITSVFNDGRKKVKHLLHRVVLGDDLSDAQEVGFRNGNGCDCRRANLIIADHQTISQQRFRPSRGMGVYRDSDGYGWRVHIRVNGVKHYGYHKTKADAIKHRDRLLRDGGQMIDAKGWRVLRGAA